MKSVHYKSQVIALVSAICAMHGLAACASNPALTDRPEVQAFIEGMVADHDFRPESLAKVFQQVTYRQDIIDAISRPAERKPWYQYRPIFLTQNRINGGVEFWNANRDTLERARQTFGVPPEIITAIIGVETFYGRQTGRYRVMDSLATLAFDYPPRSEFFRGELAQYLLLAREEQFDPLEITGSYAGAMGTPQFIASSYRNYAIDFSGDGHKDLLNNVADAIGSVANYLKLHGWEPGRPVAGLASVEGEGYSDVVEMGIKPHTTIAELAQRGIRARDENLPGDQIAALIRLDNADGQEYWLGMNNFYVITRYNHSPLYAMAVYQLAEEINNHYQNTSAHN